MRFRSFRDNESQREGQRHIPCPGVPPWDGCSRPQDVGNLPQDVTAWQMDTGRREEVPAGQGNDSYFQVSAGNIADSG